MHIKPTKYSEIRDTIPAWAEYVAIDKDGIIYAYADRPILYDLGWVPRGNFIELGEVPNAVQSVNWKGSLTAACWIRDGSVR